MGRHPDLHPPALEHRQAGEGVFDQVGDPGGENLCTEPVEGRRVQDGVEGLDGVGQQAALSTPLSEPKPLIFHAWNAPTPR